MKYDKNTQIMTTNNYGRAIWYLTIDNPLLFLTIYKDGANYH